MLTLQERIFGFRRISKICKLNVIKTQQTYEGSQLHLITVIRRRITKARIWPVSDFLSTCNNTY